MNRILGFFTVDSFIDNNTSAVNPVGEMTSVSNTYAKDIKTFSENNGDLKIMFSENDVGVTNQQISDAHAFVANSINNVITHFKSGATGAILDEVNTALVDSEYTVTVGGGILNPKDSNRNYPEWVGFLFTQDGVEWVVKVWLAGTSFESDFDEGNIQIVLPLAEAEMWKLETNFADAKSQIMALSSTAFVTKAGQEISGVYTKIKTITIEAVDRNDDTNKVDVPFLAVINGNDTYASEEKILTEVVNQLVAEVTASTAVSDWYPIFPSLQINDYDIYWVIPNWGNIAVQSQVQEPPLYSPVINLTAFGGLRDLYFPDVPSTPEVSDFTDYATLLHKSVGVFIMPDMNNPDGRIIFRTKYPDYMVIPANDNNINDLTVATRGAITVLDELIKTAETFIVGNTLPSGMITELHNDNRYVSKVAGSTKFAILTRHAFLNM